MSKTFAKIVTQTSSVKPLGKVLLQTGLVSAAQITEALQEQTHNSTLKIGEILARHGWIKQETANFLAEQWPRYLSQRKKQPLGQYLRDAALLDVEQVMTLLEEQSQTGIYFGELIVQKGWLSEETVNFFLNAIDYDIDAKYEPVDEEQFDDDSPSLQVMREQLLDNRRCDPYQLLLTYQKALSHKMLRAPESQEQSELLRLGLLVEQDHEFIVANPSYRMPLNTKWVNQELGKLRPFEKVRINLFKLDEKAGLPFAALEEVFAWTGREPFLTQALCQAIYEARGYIPANEERERIANIVYRQVIDDWPNKVAAEHLQAIVRRLTDAPNATELLERYRQVLHQESRVIPGDAAQQELLDLGLVVEQQQQLKVANRIYAAVFNEQWLSRAMTQQFFPDEQTSSALVVSSPAPLVSTSQAPERPPVPKREPRPQPISRFGRIVLGLFLLGVVGILAAIFAQRFLKNQTVTRTFDEGNALFNRGDYDAAIAKYNDVLNVDGNYHQAWTNRGYALAGIEQYSQMLSSCRSATIINPQAVYAWNCQGEALHNLKQFEDAIAAYEKAIELDPSDPVFLINKSESELALNQFDPALSTIETAIDQFGQISAQQTEQSNIDQELAIAWSTKGRVFHRTKRYTEALAAYEKSLDYNASYFPALLGKGVTLKDLEQYGAADAQFALALGQPLSENQKAELWFYSGLTLCKLWLTDEAVEAYDNALKLKPDFEAAQTARGNACS